MAVKDRWTKLAAAVAVALLALALYSPILRHGIIFNWDDSPLIERAVSLTPLTWEKIRWAFTSFEMSTYQPLGWLLYAGLAAIGGSAPWVYHAASWLLHAACVVAVYTFALSFLGRGPLVAGLAALVFAWHPAAVESVAAAAAISDLLSVTLVLWALALYERGGGRLYGAAVALSFLACLGRWEALLVPVGVFLLDRRAGRKFSLVRFAPFAAPVAILIAVYAAVKMTAYGIGSHSPRPDVMAAALWFYALKWVWPATLLPQYRFDDMFPAWASAVALLALAVFASWAWRVRRRFPGAGATALFFAACLMPTMLPNGEGRVFGHDRYLYLAGAPLSVAVAWGFSRYKQSMLAPLLAALLLGALGARAALRLDDWRDTRAFWEGALAVRPDWPEPMLSLGIAELHAGNTARALEMFELFERHEPSQARPFLALARWQEAVSYLAAGRKREARETLKQAARLDPSNERIRADLARSARH